jgi:hypothetical protein
MPQILHCLKCEVRSKVLIIFDLLQEMKLIISDNLYKNLVANSIASKQPYWSTNRRDRLFLQSVSKSQVRRQPYFHVLQRIQ